MSGELEMYTVKEASEIMSISPHTLRFYDKEGLFPALMKRNKRRLFSDRDLEWIYYIQCLRETGMGLPEIRTYIEAVNKGNETIQERHDLLVRQYSKAADNIESIRHHLKMLKRKIDFYKDRIDGKPGRNWKPDIQTLIKKARNVG